MDSVSEKSVNPYEEEIRSLIESAARMNTGLSAKQAMAAQTEAKTYQLKSSDPELPDPAREVQARLSDISYKEAYDTLISATQMQSNVNQFVNVSGNSKAQKQYMTKDQEQEYLRSKEPYFRQGTRGFGQPERPSATQRIAANVVENLPTELAAVGSIAGGLPGLAAGTVAGQALRPAIERAYRSRGKPLISDLPRTDMTGEEKAADIGSNLAQMLTVAPFQAGVGKATGKVIADAIKRGALTPFQAKALVDSLAFGAHSQANMPVNATPEQRAYGTGQSAASALMFAGAGQLKGLGAYPAQAAAGALMGQTPEERIANAIAFPALHGISQLRENPAMRKAMLDQASRLVADETGAIPLGGKPKETMSVAEAMNSGLKVRPPKGATAIRFEDAQGKGSVLNVSDADTLKGAGPYKKIEFGVRGKAGFVPMKETGTIIEPKPQQTLQRGEQAKAAPPIAPAPAAQESAGEKPAKKSGATLQPAVAKTEMVEKPQTEGAQNVQQVQKAKGPVESEEARIERMNKAAMEESASTSDIPSTPTKQANIPSPPVQPIPAAGTKPDGTVERQTVTRLAPTVEYGESAQRMREEGTAYRTPQNIQEVKDRLNTAEPAEVDRLYQEFLRLPKEAEKNVYVLAAQKKMDQLRQAGDGEGAYKVFESIAETGTDIGTMLRQYAEIKGSTPEGELFIVNSKRKKSGQTEIPPASQPGKQLLNLSEQKFAAQAKYNEVNTVESQLEFPDIVKQAKSEYLDRIAEQQRALYSIEPVNLLSDVSKTIQANLMVIPRSLEINAFGNSVLGVGNAMRNVIARGVDMLDYAIFKGIYEARRGIGKFVDKPYEGMPPVRSIYYGPKAVGYGIRGLFTNGIRKGASEVVHGVSPEDLVSGEIKDSFHPLWDFVDAFGKSKVIAIDSKGVPKQGVSRAASDIAYRAKRLVRAWLGIQSEPVFRLLQLGDTLAKETERGQVLSELGMQAGKRKGELKQFVNNPPEYASRIAQNEAKQATFQEENYAATLINRAKNVKVYSDGKYIPLSEYLPSGLKFIDGLSKIAINLNVPYVKTPVNMGFRLFRYAVPKFSLARALMYRTMSAQAKSVDKQIEYKREAMHSIGEAIVGQAIITAGSWLTSYGLLSGNYTTKDDKKVRSMKQNVFNYSSLKYDALKRVVEGKMKGLPENEIRELAKDRPGDESISTIPLGIIGAIWQIESDRELQEERDNLLKTVGVNNSEDMAFVGAKDDMIRIMRAVLEFQGAKGPYTILNAVMTGETDSYLRTLGNALTSIGVPKTITSFLRAKNETRLADVTIDSGLFKNVLKQNVGLGNEIYPMRGLFGEKIPKTQKGQNAYVSELISIWKTRINEGDPYYAEMYRLYQSTARSEHVPSIPGKITTYTGNKVVIPPEEYDKYKFYVGYGYRQAYKQIVNSDGYKALDDYQKVDLLSKALESAKRQIDEAYLPGLLKLPKKITSKYTKMATLEEMQRVVK